MSGCSGPVVPPCFKVPEGTETVALESDKHGARVVFLDRDGNKIEIENNPIITVFARIEKMEIFGGKNEGFCQVSFLHDVLNGCEAPLPYKENIVNNW